MKFFDYLEGKIGSDFVVVYTGRFCPPHVGHLNVFKKLQQKFGDDKVFILTSDKSSTSPLSFDEKVELFKMYGVNPAFVKKMSSSGYNGPAIIKSVGKTEMSGLVVAIGEKDKDRLKIDGLTKAGSPTYFRTYTGEVSLPSSEAGYVFIIKNEMSGEKIISATTVREAIKDNNYEIVKEYMPEKIFNKAKEFLSSAP